MSAFGLCPDVQQVGPNLPTTCDGNTWQRVKQVVGHTPAHAVAEGNCGGYTISDLKWDLKHGYLVVPDLESTPNPNPEAKAFVEVGRAQTVRRPGTGSSSGVRGRAQGDVQVHDVGSVAGCLLPDCWRRAAAETSA